MPACVVVGGVSMHAAWTAGDVWFWLAALTFLIGAWDPSLRCRGRLRVTCVVVAPTACHCSPKSAVRGKLGVRCLSVAAVEDLEGHMLPGGFVERAAHLSSGACAQHAVD
jgi:hypothetical protein